MIRFAITGLLQLSILISFAQIGIGTTTPNSTLDVRGSLSTNYRAFTSSTTADADYALVFTGTSAATLTLPDATVVTGRVYWIKNASSNASTLSIATTSSQTIDGSGSWSLTQTNKVVAVVSNGANWYTVSESVPGNSAGSAWVQGGNNVSSQQSIGTISDNSLPFITNNNARMTITNTGNVGIGSTGFQPSNPEKLLVDAGTTSSFNVISGKGSIDNYLQLNIQNNSGGASASSDVVATANNGNENQNYVDLGINGGGNTSGGIYGGANTSYLYNIGGHFTIGNSTNNKDLIFFTNGVATTDEKLRITASSGIKASTNFLPNANNTYNLGSAALRWATIYSQNLLNVSDARLKTNVRDLHYGLSTIINIRPVQFNWKEGNDKDRKIGFLAQELRSVIPEVVVGDESKETLTVNYIELIPVLVNAIKEQQQQIEVLKKKVTVLENR